MNCTCIRIKAIDQRLTVVQQPILASGDVESVRVEYAFDSLWDGYTPFGTFYNGKHPEDVYEQRLTGGACIIPWEVLQDDGVLYIGLRGADGKGRVKTAVPVRYRIEKGSPCGSATASGPTPGIYEQLLALLLEKVGGETGGETGGNTGGDTGGGSLIITDDGNGNVIITASGDASITDDGNGNVNITTSGGVSITDDGNGNVVIA